MLHGIYDTIDKIEGNKEIWGTKITLLNDKCEGEGDDTSQKENTYIVSFTHELYENLEEWVLYGDLCSGGRLSINENAWLLYQ